MEKTLESTLEWPQLVDLARDEAYSEPARHHLESLKLRQNWAKDIETAKNLQQELQDIFPLLDRRALWDPLQDLLDPTQTIDLLSKKTVLEVLDLGLLRSWLIAMESWSLIPRQEIRGEKLKKSLSLLPDPLEPLKIIEHVLTPQNEISEKASPTLTVLFSEIRSLKKEMSTTVQSLIQIYFQKGILQGQYSDTRDGRVVIPVKISAQNEIAGITHEASVSKQTVYIEPKEITPLNNALKQKENALLEEIFNVLKKTSEKLYLFSGDIRLGVSILAHWDSVGAKAILGRKISGKPIHVTSEKKWELSQTAHPFLWKSLPPETIVRNSIYFSDPTYTLLLTGPNTGGKTVLLKALGLASLCAKTGFPFPNSTMPTVPFFDQIFADLGDPQSIEEHLSSFSGHILKFKEILDNFTKDSLVLIDELNTATDPSEGAAIGRAFLETLMNKGAMVVATTHDPYLKANATSDPRILNVSLSFDENSKSPTFKLNFGVIGRSRALETAEKLGFPKEVLELAKSYLSKDQVKFEQLLAKLEHDAHSLSSAKKEAERLEKEALGMKEEWTERTRTSLNDLMDRTRQKLRRILEQAQDEVRAKVQKLDEIKSRKEIDQTRNTLNQDFTLATKNIEDTLTQEAPEIAALLSASPPSSEIHSDYKVGVQVKLPKWKSFATVLEIHGNKAKVAMGNLQMSVFLNELEPAPQEKTRKSNVKMLDQNRPAAPEPEIDLRGLRLDEALTKLEHYLDQAYRCGILAQVTIVHGLGSGAIRENTRKLLGTLPYIKSYKDGGPGAGGAGATVVEFD